MATVSSATIRTLRLEPIAGPPQPPLSIASDKPFVIGRQSSVDGLLTDASVSRRHAVVTHKAGTWYLGDLQSSHGTILNGVRLEPDGAAPIRDGDLVRIGPWTFRVGAGAAAKGAAHLQSTSNDVGSTVQRVQRIPARELALRAQHRLELLIDCAAAIAAAATEAELADAALSALVSGTGFPRAAFLRRIGADGAAAEQVEVLGVKGPAAGEQGLEFSRSLLQAAAGGEVVKLEDMRAGAAGMGGPAYAHSVVQLGIQAAVCAPLLLDGQVVAFLYLDARGQELGGAGRNATIAPEPALEADAPAFCRAVARISALALANISRRAIQLRQREVEADLAAAREVQRRIMPSPTGRVGALAYAVASRPGHFVAGDLFDMVELPGGRCAVLMGDVSGKGLDAAMLMATAQAFLNASLRHTGDPAAALAEVNRHVCEHGGLGGGSATEALGSFITLWLGVIEGGRLTFVDGGHGHCLLARPGGVPERLVPASGGVPVGIDPAWEYVSDTVELPAGSRLVLYSDGLVEQPSPSGEAFGLARAVAALGGQSAGPEGDVEALLGALVGFAAGEGGNTDRVVLSDDVTIASVHVGE